MEIIVLEKFKKHWFVALLVYSAAIISTTWKVADEINTKPRDFKINQLQEEVHKLQASVGESKNEDPLMLKETGVFAGTSATTKDGRCSVHILSVEGDSISLAITIDSNPPIKFEKRKPGERININAGTKKYLVDLRRVRGNIVDIEVYSG